MSVCERALCIARKAPAALTAAAEAAPEPGGAGGAADGEAGGAGGELAARLSLLSETLVRPKPKYASFKQDHTLGEYPE